MKRSLSSSKEKIEKLAAGSCKVPAAICSVARPVYTNIIFAKRIVSISRNLGRLLGQGNDHWHSEVKRMLGMVAGPFRMVFCGSGCL